MIPSCLKDFLTTRVLPRLACIQILTNNKQQACYSIYKLGLDVRMPTHKLIKAFNTPWFGTGKVIILLITQWLYLYNQSRLLLHKPRLGSSLPSSKCTFAWLLLSTFSYVLGKWMGFNGGRRDNWGMLRQFSQKGWNNLAKEGMGNMNSFIVLMSRCGMRLQHLLLYDKRMVIQLGDEL